MRPARSTPFLLLFLVAASANFPGVPASFERAPTAAVKGLAQGQTIGTIRASFDGEPRQWYVVSGVANGRTAPGAFWMQLADERMAVVGGFDTEDIDFSTFETQNGMPSSMGSYTGSVMSITFSFQPGQAEASFTAGDLGANVIYVDDVSGGMTPDHMYSLSEGGFDVTRIRTEGGACSIAGTFAGELEPVREGAASIQVSDGTFEVDGCVEMKPEQGP